jgi:diguanylate cyclase (GGDEF)-like protein/PAS domain S-box-containing protein
MSVKSLDAYRTHRRSLKGAQILVVDDEATVRKIIQQFLENAGFTVTVASSGEQALHCLVENTFDLMLLDILMPDLSGDQVLEKVRQKFSKSELLVIMVTAKEESADMLKAFSLGANDYVVKPLDFTILRSRIEMHLSHQRAEKELREARDALEKRVEERTEELLAANRTLVNEITEHKQTEQILRETEQTVSLVLNSAGEGIYGLDIDGNTKFINPAGANMLGWETSELIGKPLHTVVHHTRSDGSHYPIEECPIYAAIKDGKVHQASDEVFWRKDGSSFPVEYTSTPIRQAGELVGAVVVYKNITERKQAEEALLFMQTTVDQAGDVIYWLGPDGEFLYANDVASEFFGYSKEELASICISDIDPDYPKPLWQEHWLEVKRLGTMLFEARPHNKEGEAIEVEITETYVNHENKEYLFGVLRDITKRKKMEEKLERSYVLFKQAEQMGKLGHWEWDKINKKMISVSEEFARNYEMSVDEAIEFFSSWENELSVIHPQDRARYAQHIIDSEEANINVDIEYRILTDSGIVRHMHLQGEYEFDDKGNIIKSFGAEQDITERKLAEEELRVSHKLFSQAEKMGKLGHWEWDIVADCLISCSEQYAQIFEMSVEEKTVASSKSFYDDAEEFIHEDDLERYLQEMETAYMLKRAWDIEYRILNKSGRVVYVRELGEPLLDENDNLIKTFGTLQDITERKQAEEEILHLAYHDELTGLPTLRLGKDRLTNAIASARRNKNQLAVLFLDLDGFKEVNDSMGHKAGDHVLKEVGARLTNIVRDTDTVARIGGDEFIIILTAIVEDTVVIKMAEKVVEALCLPIDIDGQNAEISTSIGIALYPDHGKEPDDLIVRADSAMYTVKREGKNNYIIDN